MLIVEFSNEREEVIISFDALGANKLIDAVKKLVDSRNDLDHDHLMTPSWGGHELDEMPFTSGAALVHHLRLVWSRHSEA